MGKTQDSHWTSDATVPSRSGAAAQSVRGQLRPIQDRAQRIAIMGELAGGILHEFNNILTVVSGTIDILALAAVERPQLAAVVRLVDEAASRGARLTSYFQAFERGQPPRCREVDIGALVSDAERLLRPALEGQTEVRSSAATGLPAAAADPGLLLVALLSLAMAAHGAMPHGGAIALDAGDLPGGENDGGHLVIMLDATSQGSVDNFAKRIVDGLGMAEAWIEQAGAQLRIVRQASRNAAFELHLPRANLASALAER
ncbi:histidine kinase [Bradyrhizobium sp.]|uniref:histidine kinase n=1 Tax=Bradyrhizobium sp. TaxID=376 RepID=UPI001DAACD8C|nr:histidine kinase [Bradyrhizobium sp.]MBV8701241.1 histidine kinase [Bradyrhizobium sp.]MBV8923001.1 histidine kinase [Bradyrhizobium sp.]MBV9982214.1 histidine kinase [Bradyrhizobium sp.]